MTYTRGHRFLVVVFGNGRAASTIEERPARPRPKHNMAMQIATQATLSHCPIVERGLAGARGELGVECCGPNPGILVALRSPNGP